MAENMWQMSGKNFRQRDDKKYDPLTKTGELTLGNTGMTYDINQNYGSTAGSFTKPTQLNEISSVRNQLKLIKGGQKEDQQLDQQMNMLNDEISELDKRVREKDTNYKPVVARNRSIPLKEESKFNMNAQYRNPFQFTTQNNETQQPQAPVSGSNMINMSRRKREGIDDVGSGKKTQNLELFLPDDKPNKINIIKKSEDEEFLLESTVNFEKPPKPTVIQPPQQKNISSPIQEEGLYMPSLVNNEKVKRNVLPGSKNPLDEKPAIAYKEFVDQLKEAELEQPVEDEDLQVCPEGCGRSFKLEALEKHIKVCKAVFQQKRKEFNSKSHRLVSQEQQKLIRQGQIKEKQIQKQMQKTQGGGKKWKEQSDQFRNIVKNDAPTEQNNVK